MGNYLLKAALGAPIIVAVLVLARGACGPSEKLPADHPVVAADELHSHVCLADGKSAFYFDHRHTDDAPENEGLRSVSLPRELPREPTRIEFPDIECFDHTWPDWRKSTHPAILEGLERDRRSREAQDRD